MFRDVFPSLIMLIFSPNVSSGRTVLEEHKPILYVSHDEDGYWQFLCGGSHKEEDARVVSLASILNIDETMGDLAGLDYGECAEAEDAASDWMVKCTLSEGMK